MFNHEQHVEETKTMLSTVMSADNIDVFLIEKENVVESYMRVIFSYR